MREPDTDKATVESWQEQLRNGNTWSEKCPIPLTRLARLPIQFVDFNGQEHQDGEIVVLDVVAERVLDIFSLLFKQAFPINKIESVHQYHGDDDVSMADNNTSCFNYRTIAGTNVVSIHGYGLAIDLNPLQNPMVTFEETSGTPTIHPRAGWRHLNRNKRVSGMVEELIPMFHKHGFTVWGGNWTSPIDYHHFQPPRGIAELLAALDFADGRKLFENFVDSGADVKEPPDRKRLEEAINLYRQDRTKFFDNYLSYL